jgi:hypothetical protein
MTEHIDGHTHDSAPAVEIPLYARIQGAKAWKPKSDRIEAEALTGTVVAITARTSEYGTYPVVVVDTGAEFLAFHAFHTLALEQLKALKPAPGESITIVAHPKAASRKRKDTDGKPVGYWPYTIFNPDTVDDSATTEFDWDDFDDEPGF